MSTSPPPRRSRRSRVLRSGLAVLLLAPAVTTLLPSDPARAESSYDAFAKANGIDAVISNPSIPLGLDLQGLGPEAEAGKNSLGVADASAQFPYTGGTVPGLPGALGALFGLPIPPFPFIAAATAGGPPARVSYPGLTLEAESGDFISQATGTAGTDGAGLSSTARVEEKRNGDVVATATTTAPGLKIGNVLALSGITTTATVSASGSSGEVTRTSSTSIGQISVPGLVLEVPRTTPGAIPIPIPIPGIPNIPPIDLPVLDVPFGGLQLANPRIGITDGSFVITDPTGGSQQEFAVPAKFVLDALKAAGISITFQAPEETATGIIAGTYTFAYTSPALPENQFFNGAVRIRQTTGLAVASVNLKPVLDSGGTGTGTGSGSGSGTGSGVDGGATSGGLPGGTSGDGGSGLPGLSPLDPGTGGTGGIPGVIGTPTPDIAAPGSTGGDEAAPRFQLRSLDLPVGIGDLYLALVAIGVAGFAASTALRLIGVRFLWNS